MNIEVGYNLMGLHGLLSGSKQLTVAETTTAGQIEGILRSQHELLVGWWIISAPESFRARISAEGAAARKAAIETWNKAVLAALPKVIARIKSEQAVRGEKWGSKALKNAEGSIGAAERSLATGAAWSVGSEIERKGNHLIGVSYATWKKVHDAVAPEDRLPLGL